MKIDVCPGDDFQTFSISLIQMDRTCWTLQTHLDLLNWARRRTFLELNSLSLIRLIKSSNALPRPKIPKQSSPWNCASRIVQIFCSWTISVSVLTDVIKLLNVSLTSEATNDSGKTPSTNGLAYITVNGKNYAPKTKGFNVAVFDHLSGKSIIKEYCK